MCKSIFHIQSLVIYSFATPPMKLKLGRQIGVRLLIANHLNQSSRWANQKHWPAVRSYLLHSFLQVHGVAVTFTSQQKPCNYVKPKPFSSATQLHILDFLHPNFTLQDHILSIGGDVSKRLYINSKMSNLNLETLIYSIDGIFILFKTNPNLFLDFQFLPSD
jgi:hypothetical protein